MDQPASKSFNFTELYRKMLCKRQQPGAARPESSQPAGRLILAPAVITCQRGCWQGGGIATLFHLDPSRRLPLVILAALTALGPAAAGCSRPAEPVGLGRLHACTSAEGPTDALCGSLSVYENREARSGRRISLNIVVLPSLAPEAAPDPLFFLAGGPGQGAAKMAPEIRDIFRPILRRRDIVLVDQRGTGKSNPLECRNESNSLQQLTESDEVSLTRLEKCLAGYDADVRFYTTPIAMDDLDDIRAYLGYDKVNLYGGSYGTRAALVYVRQHSGHVRSIVLDGVAPTDMRIPLFSARDAQRALDKLLADCEADEACRSGHPGLAARVRALLQRLNAQPVRVELMHPRTGIRETTTIDARIVTNVLFGALYSPLTASLVPTLIDRAEQNDFQNLLALGFASETSNDNLSIGMQLSVLCSEDAARVSSEDVSRETAGTVFGTHLMHGQLQACEKWPRGTIDASYFEPVTSDVPALVLSGDVDPITPPGWGEEVAGHLKNARHITMPGTGHGVIGTACGQDLIKEFIDEASVANLDVSCVNRVRRPPFFLTPAGPEPALQKDQGRRPKA